MSLKQTFSNLKSNIINNKLIYISFFCFGLFIGALLADFTGVGKGKISLNYLSGDAGSVFQAGDKTWVSYANPPIEMTVLSDFNCGYCDASKDAEMIKQNISPTIMIKDLDAATPGGKNLIDLFSIKSLPVFVFSKDIEDLDIYPNIKQLFKQQGAYVLLDSAKASLEPCKILNIPKISDAKADIIEISDYQCPYCKQASKTLRDVRKDYTDKEVQITHKHLPLDFHQFAEGASIAAECVRKQGEDKFQEMNDALFDAQFNSEDDIKAAAKKISAVNYKDFETCFDNNETQNIVDLDKNWATNLGISGTPAFIINGRYVSGARSKEAFGEIIDEELGK